MKKYLHATRFIILLLLFAVPQIILAQAGNSQTIENPISSKTFADFIDKILKVVIQIGYVVVVFFIVYSGFLFVSARGNEAELSKAKTSFLWTVIGAAIILGAQVLEKGIANTIENLNK